VVVRCEASRSRRGKDAAMCTWCGMGSSAQLEL